MQTPQDTLASAKDRAAEITWWNRRITKLNQVNGITYIGESIRFDFQNNEIQYGDEGPKKIPVLELDGKGSGTERY